MNGRAEQEPIRILRVIARLNVGGPAQHVAYLSRGLDERGYQTTLVAGRIGEGEGSMEDLVRAVGVQPVFISALQRNISPFDDAVAVWRLVRLLRELRPHVLHTHTAKAGAIGRIAVLLAGARPPVVVHTFHGHVLRGYFGPLITAAFLRVENLLGRASDALIAVSNGVREDLVQLGVAPREKIVVIPLGLDLERRVAVEPGERERQRAELGIDPETFAIGWLGRMTEIKRVDDLLRAFALLRRADVDAVLVLVGDGPLRASLERLARELGVDDRCRFLGYQEEVGGLYAAVDAVALTSANEGTPVTIIEALAAGTPVVSTDVGGVRDVVDDGRSGLLVPAGDVDSIAAALRRLAEDGELRDRLALHGPEIVQRYSVDRLVDDVDRLYRALLAQGAPADRQVVSGLHRPLTPALPPEVRTRVPAASRRLRVLLFSQYFPPEVGATQSRMQSFAEYLAARGHQVTVVAEFPNHPLGVVPPEYRGRVIEDDRSNPYRVLRVWVLAAEEKTQATRMAFYLSYMALASAVAPFVGRADVVIATTPPLFTGVAGAAAARFNRAPLVLDVRDLWPAAAVSLGQISAGIALRSAEVLERLLYREASAVVAVTHPFCEHIDRIRGRPPATAMIPNGTLELFFDVDGRQPSEALGVPDGRYVVTFAGTHGIAQALPSVLDAAERLRGEPVSFVFVGEGPMKDHLVRQAAARGIDNVVFRPQVPLEQVPHVLAASDALLVPLSAHETFADFVPSKMIDCMAAARPVILTAQGEASRLLQRAGAGVAVPPENPEALADAVRWLQSHPDEAQRMARRGRDFARKRMRSVQAERLEQVLLDVAAR